MKYLIRDYKIRSYQYGYVLTKKKGKKQWTCIGYYNSAERAIEDLFDYRVKTETSDYIIDFNNKANLKASKAKLLEKIEEIKKELMEGLSYGD